MCTTRRTLISAYPLKLYLWSQNWTPSQFHGVQLQAPGANSATLWIREPGAAAGSEICLEEFQNAGLV